MAKLSFVGGGSMFVPSIVNGLGEALRQGGAPFEVELALYDIRPDSARRMARYADVVAEAWDVPLHMTVAATRDEALAAADAVIVSVWLDEEHRRIEALYRDLAYVPPEEGPGVAAWAVHCVPWALGVAEDMRRLCPGALFLTVMNPTDVTAGAVAEIGHVRAAGMCVEVDGLRGALAYYLQVDPDEIVLDHAGVNHDGWVLRWQVGGQDGYATWSQRLDALAQDPGYHPGNRIIPHIASLTGHLKSSGYHQWPYQVTETEHEQALWDRWRGKRPVYEAALKEALATGTPIKDPPGIHPERSKLNYPLTGQAVGRLMRAIATGEAHALPLQVHNHGAVTNVPEGAIVEVPVLVQGRKLRPQPMGELPEWLGGVTRLLAIQRRLIIDYLIDGELRTLERALAVLPMYGTAQQLRALAEALHEAYLAAEPSHLSE
jgi:alpha-galactosidase/6-phospho-beta-glucosidase family protein